MNENSTCVVLVPVGNRIEPDCERALRKLEEQGYAVWRIYGYAAIDQARSQIATDALAQGFKELMWIDSDIVFDPTSVERLRAHELPLVCGIYAKKGPRELACHLSPETSQIRFGKEGGLLEIVYASTGFLLTHREVYDDIQRQCALTVCNQRFQRPMVPYFLPLVVPDGPGGWYLAEDFAFCHRARSCGHGILADTTIRLRHLGTYGFGWEDAGGELSRYGSYTFHVNR